MLNSNIEKVAQVQCLDNNGYWMKRTLFLNISELTDDCMETFLDKLKDIPNSYTTVRSVLYD